MDFVIEKIRAIIHDVARVEAHLINPSSTLAGLHLNDLDIDEVLHLLEIEFELTLSKGEEIELAGKTLQGMADYVAARTRS